VTISARLKLNILVSTVLVLIMSGAFGWALMIERDAAERDIFGDDLMRGMSELNEVTHFYLSHPEERPKKQWKLTYDSVSEMLNRPLRGGGKNIIIDRMRENFSDLGILFDELAATHEKGVPGPSGSTPDEPLLQSKRRQLADLIALRSRNITQTAAAIAAESTTEMRDISRKTAVFFPVFAVVMVAITVWFSMRIRRSIEIPMKLLRQGTEIIGSGNLGHKVATSAHDEIGDLSRAFDDMTEKLKAVTVSKDELLREISERKQAEADILKLSEDMAARNLELESANKEMESFIYSMSHDLRAPIRTVSGFAKIIIEDYADKLDEQAKSYLNRIQNGAEKTTRLIDDLLRLSRISRQDMDLIEMDLSAKALSVIADLREANPARNVQARIAPGIRAAADPRLLEVVLSNLLGNAWKFTSKTDNAQIEFGTTEKDGKTVYYVKDNGAGFDRTYAEKMFLPFHRLHSVNEFEGTGIGLTIVERIIRRHGGRIWAEGEVGKGAAFYFTLG
jgi:signal transduction histidine kinase